MKKLFFNFLYCVFSMVYKFFEKMDKFFFSSKTAKNRQKTPKKAKNP